MGFWNGFSMMHDFKGRYLGKKNDYYWTKLRSLKPWIKSRWERHVRCLLKHSYSWSFSYSFATVSSRTLHEMALQSDLECSFLFTGTLMHCKLQCNTECFLWSKWETYKSIIFFWGMNFHSFEKADFSINIFHKQLKITYFSRVSKQFHKSKIISRG